MLLYIIFTYFISCNIDLDMYRENNILINYVLNNRILIIELLTDILRSQFGFPYKTNLFYVITHIINCYPDIYNLVWCQCIVLYACAIISNVSNIKQSFKSCFQFII